ncbi:MAG: CPBP family intramembrane metalloprotease [Bdellovibrionaceae bacterium]|nr:CPBP family intramembrane metalloprotease [Pseudobdellovibrionaceae bacterium]
MSSLKSVLFRPVWLWVVVNLVFSYFLVDLLPDNIIHFAAGMWMPGLSAIIFLLIEKKPLKPALNFSSESFFSYVLSFSLVTFVAIGTVLVGLSSGYLTLNPLFQFKIANLILGLLIWCFFALGEELGWRGYLQNHIRDIRHAPLVIGLIWFFWHHQILSQGPDILTLSCFLCGTVCISYILFWLTANGGSVLTCGFFHGLWNFYRIGLLFGNPEQGKMGLFSTSDARLTEMEGLFGIIFLFLVSLYFIFQFYKKPKLT